MYNDYNRDNKTDEVSYYPVYEDYEPHKKKGGKTALKIICGLACAAVISAGSIGAYIVVDNRLSGSPQQNNQQNAIMVESSEEDTSSESEGSPEIMTGTPDSKAESVIAQSSPTSASSIITVSDKKNILTIPEIVQKVNPSVVGVSSQLSNGTSTGTGIVMTSDGYIITNAHVVDGAQKISVILSDGSENAATLIGEDTRTDVAVLKINVSGLTAAEFGDSDSIVVGESVVAIGNPLGFNFAGSVTDGIISGLNREVIIEDRKMNLMQTNAAINSGNSGGPLVNMYGQVIGITSAKVSTYFAEGMCFAIPINTAVPIVEDLITNGYVTGRPLIGISGKDISESMAAYYNVPQGVLIAQINEGTPAASTELRVGDIIIGLADQEITTMSQLNSIKETYKPGDTVSITVYRDGQTLKMPVTLGEERS